MGKEEKGKDHRSKMIKKIENFERKFNVWRRNWIAKRKNTVSEELTSLLPWGESQGIDTGRRNNFHSDCHNDLIVTYDRYIAFES